MESAGVEAGGQAGSGLQQVRGLDQGGGLKSHGQSEMCFGGRIWLMGQM